MDLVWVRGRLQAQAANTAGTHAAAATGAADTTTCMAYGALLLESVAAGWRRHLLLVVARGEAADRAGALHAVGDGTVVGCLGLRLHLRLRLGAATRPVKDGAAALAGVPFLGELALAADGELLLLLLLLGGFGMLMRVGGVVEMILLLLLLL